MKIIIGQKVGKNIKPQFTNIYVKTNCPPTPLRKLNISKNQIYNLT